MNAADLLGGNALSKLYAATAMQLLLNSIYQFLNFFPIRF